MTRMNRRQVEEGLTLVYDVVRRFSQPLAIHLGPLGEAYHRIERRASFGCFLSGSARRFSARMAPRARPT